MLRRCAGWCRALLDDCGSGLDAGVAVRRGDGHAPGVPWSIGTSGSDFEGRSVSKAQAGQVADAVFSAIANALVRDESVVIPGFGTFSTKSREARQGRNPRTGESITIAASKSPSFKAGKTLRDAVRG